MQGLPSLFHRSQWLVVNAEHVWQARVNPAETKSRVKDSEKRIDTKLAPYINKAYW